MILTEKVKVKISSYNFNYFKELDFDIKKGDEIEIKPEQLMRYSEVIIKVKCDNCNSENEIKNSVYNLNRDRNNGIYSCLKCKGNNIKKTNIEKYGVENVSQVAQIKEKKKETNLKNWGTENVFQSEKIKEISKKTKKEKYNDENFTNREKSKETCLKNNGVEWPTQSKEILNIRNLNNKKKYGTESYTQTLDCQNKIKNTCFKKYGKKSYLSTDDCQIKSRITCNEKYGVDYPSQNYEIHKKQFPKMKIHSCGVKYQGSYEKDFLDLCEKLNIIVERGKSIKYIYKGSERIYFSDYYLKDFNLIVEIKSTYIYKLHEERNIEKRKASITCGYNFLFIIDKKYDDLLTILSSKN